MPIFSDEDLNDFRAELIELMPDTCTIFYPGAASNNKGVTTRGTETSDTSQCRLSYGAPNKRAGGVSESLTERLQGRSPWTLTLPYGKLIDISCRVEVQTRGARRTKHLQVLEVIDEQSDAIEVKAICAEIVKKPVT